MIVIDKRNRLRNPNRTTGKPIRETIVTTLTTQFILRRGIPTLLHIRYVVDIIGLTGTEKIGISGNYMRFWSAGNGIFRKMVNPGMHQVSDFGVSNERLEALCKQYGVKELSIFGSRARGDNRPDSDIDLLVEFFPDTVLGLIGYGRFRDELSQLFGVPVDLAPRHGLKPIIRDYALPDIKPLYEAA